MIDEVNYSNGRVYELCVCGNPLDMPHRLSYCKFKHPVEKEVEK